MTATPRMYDNETKSKAAKAEAVLWSMDDEKVYGDEIYRIGFGEAVEKKLLTDYKVLILTLSESDVPPTIQRMITNEEKEIKLDDLSKLIGCINALSKQVLGDSGLVKATDPNPMQRAVAFCSTIANSQAITQTFNAVSDVYVDELPKENQDITVSVSSKHIDGTMSATERETLMNWLKDQTQENECRVLTNVRCLSEGVDVPSLDAVMFLSARNSQVDVVQSVGRVMRLSEGKQYGYIIIPVVVPSTVSAEVALDDNERFKVVWTVLNALRAHDDRFNATINKIELNKRKPANILVGGTTISFDENGHPIEKGAYDGGSTEALEKQLQIQFEELQNIVFARMVQKVGDRRYWEQWAQSVGEIANRQKERILKLIVDSSKHAKEFERFLKGLRKSINPSIELAQAVDMLSQHIITKPVFEALFEGYSFVHNNPMSKAMQRMLDLLEEQTIEEDVQTLQKFYDSVKMRASGIDNAEGKQKIILELYDKFFKTAFPKMVEQLGIVYTPVEVVDFIIHSVADILEKEFGRTLSDENVHILDPFTGTGTFITRLLQSGRIKPQDLERKYKHEIHANEIVLLAYYIASVNIENVFHDLTPDPEDGIGKDNYIPFEGICLTDTFQLGETKEGDQLFDEMFPQNSKRVEKQQKTPLRVIIGNPPYSRGQEDANDNAQNQIYPKLEFKISTTYAKKSQATLNRDLYNSYMKAFRWSADRLDKNGGIVGFITGSGWIDKGGYDGFRRSLEEEFSSVYVINLRGDIRGRSREGARKEGQNVFDIMTGVAITILVKNPKSLNKNAQLHYYDIGDYLNRKEKFTILNTNKSYQKLKFEQIFPNENSDWINQRSASFDDFIPLEPSKNFDNKSNSFFLMNGVGPASARESWVYNYSKDLLSEKMKGMISYYNNQRIIYQSRNDKKVEEIVDLNPKKISWSRSLRRDVSNNMKHKFESTEITFGQYRPFNCLYFYYHKPFVESPGLGRYVFPSKDSENLLITLPGKGNRKDFASLVTKYLPDYNNYDGGCKYFPLYYYEENNINQKGLFDDPSQMDFIRRDAISDFIYKRAKEQYGKSVTKEDIFYYVYGFLHSKEYRETFANDLKKILPKIPLLESVPEFWAFSKAGRQLAELHLNYEDVPPYKGVIQLFNQVPKEEIEKGLSGREIPDINYQVQKMRFPKKNQKDTIIYNNQITITNIPDVAYQYVVNGKSAIEWIMERYQITTDTKSGITNNPNDWAAEVGNPRYILDLLLRIINVSVQTVEIVNNLPKVKFD